MNVKALALLLSLFIIPLFTLRASEVGTPWPSDLYDRLRSDISDEVDDAGADLQESLFESLSDFSLIEAEFGDLRLSFDVQRKVYKNYDLLNSYTVIDYMRLPIEWPIPLGDRVSIGGGGLQFQLGLTIMPELMNIRQVLPKDLDQLGNILDMRTLLQDEITSLSDNEILTPDLNILPWNSENPLTRARYYKFWNLFTQPLKLPLSAELLQERLMIGEIMSYALKGRIELGASVGWSAIDIPGLDEVTPGVGVTTYLDGTHRISVMREDETHALVKLTKARSTGETLGLGATHPDHVLFEGLVVLGARVGEISADVVPFSFTVGKNRGEAFDVTYRYDLDSEMGIKAYEEAMLGRFKKSDLLSATKNGVEKVYTRNLNSTSSSRTYKMELSFFAERSHTVSETNMIALVTLGDGRQVKLHRAISSNFRVRDTLLGHKEVKSYEFKATLDEELFNQGSKGLVLRLEGKIEDSDTRSSELYRYMTEVETLSGQAQFFPRPPKHFPAEDGDKLDLANYGETSFYFRLGLTRAQIEKFLATDESRMWSILERAFVVKPGTWRSFLSRAWYGTIRSPLLVTNLPLAMLDLHIKAGSKLVRAKEFKNDWLKLQRLYFDKSKNSEITKELTHLFTARYFSYELARVLRVVLEGEDLSYYLAGQGSHLFGHLSKAGVELDPLDATYDALDRDINFDRAGGRDLIDQNFQVKELKVTRVNDDTYHVTFELPLAPDFLFVDLDRTSNWKPYKNLARFINANKYGEFKKGANTIVVTRTGSIGVAKELAPHFFSEGEQWLTLSLAIGQGSKWGALTMRRDLYSQ